MSAPQSLAERFRAAREAFELAQQLGCTPAEAREELDRRAAWAKHERLIARAKGTPQPPRKTATPAQAYQAQQRLLGERDD